MMMVVVVVVIDIFSVFRSMSSTNICPLFFYWRLFFRVPVHGPVLQSSSISFEFWANFFKIVLSLSLPFSVQKKVIIFCWSMMLHRMPKVPKVSNMSGRDPIHWSVHLISYSRDENPVRIHWLSHRNHVVFLHSRLTGCIPVVVAATTLPHRENQHFIYRIRNH